MEKKPVIISVPDGPNVIEHHENLVAGLSKNFRVICFELPGFGFSFPSFAYDYSLDQSAKVILQLMDILNVETAALALSCSNGFYAIKAAQIAPGRITHLFLSQTPSLHAMKKWKDDTIPKILMYPVIGQLANALMEKKLAKAWYRSALPKDADITDFQSMALNALKNGGCFCLSGLVQGLGKDMNSELSQTAVPSTQIWGKMDFSHRRTDGKSILEHLPHCETIEFDSCGHFPELENTHDFVKLINERLRTQ